MDLAESSLWRQGFSAVLRLFARESLDALAGKAGNAIELDGRRLARAPHATRKGGRMDKCDSGKRSQQRNAEAAIQVSNELRHQRKDSQHSFRCRECAN